jgi:NAD(P)H-hydrate epimerase
LRAPYEAIIKGLNSFNSYKAAVDIPSGLEVDTASGEPVFDADLTVSLGELKRGLFYGEGYKYSGAVVKGYIGIGAEYFDSLTLNDYLIEPEDAFLGLPFKQLNSHKYSAGKVLVIAGSGRLPGASFLTTNSVLRGGAGAAILAFPESIKNLAQSQLKSAVVEPYKDNSSESLSRENILELKDRLEWADVIAAGPGLGRTESAGEAVKELLKRYSSKKIVLDADAIYPLNNGEFRRFNLKKKILTPHHKEFADLMGLDLEKLRSEILNIGREFALSTGSYLVLKGAPTIIFNPKGEALINSAGNPGLAKFGSGDVLTGLIAAFISQSNDIENALIASVYIHSLTADILLDDKSEFGINAEDLVENIPSTITFLRNSFVRSV